MGNSPQKKSDLRVFKLYYAYVIKFYIFIVNSWVKAKDSFQNIKYLIL